MPRINVWTPAINDTGKRGNAVKQARLKASLGKAPAYLY